MTDEGEWLNIGVVNPDNSAGWNLASEAGDKGDPRYSPDGARMLYTRGLRGEVRLGERATSGASADLLDSGMGVVSAPRWLLGRTWGQTSDSLKLEGRFPPETVAQLRARGHEVEVLGDFDETFGHAGCLLREPSGSLLGGADPRSDGTVAAF